MSFVAVAVAGGAIVGGVISASGSKSAANTQAEAANRATDSQQAMFDKAVGLEAPFRQSGIDAQTKLNNLLGIGAPPVAASATGASAGPRASFGGLPAGALGGGAESVDAIRARLAPQFTKVGNGAIVPANDGTDNMIGIPGESTVDQAGLDAAVQAELANQQATPQAGGAPAAFGPLGAPLAAGADPGAPGAGQSFGSLLKPFGMEDFQLDPGIQFQMKQGQQALQSSQAAKDGVMSGAALKSLIGFNQGMAGTGYQSAFDRYMANKSFTLGSLSDTANRGQAAAGNTVNAAPAFSSGIAGTIQGAGNASAAGTVGAANAISGGISNASTPFLLRNLISSNGGGGGPMTPFSFGSGSINDGSSNGDVG